MTKAERREKRKEILIQNREFKQRLLPLSAKGYRASLRYEDLLVADDGKAYVNVDLTKIDSPFSIFSYDKRMDPEIFDYIDSQVFFLRVAIPIVINFDDGGKYNDELKEKIRKYVKRHYSLEYEDKRMENRKSILFGLGTILIGLIVLGLHFLIMYAPNSKTGDVFNELTLITAWMFIWQSLDNFLITGHSRRIGIYNSGQLALAEVTFGKPRQ